MTESIIPILEPAPAVPSRAPSTTWRRTFRRFRRNKTAMAGAIAIMVIATAALLAPLIAPYEIDEIGSEFMGTFSSAHWLGTDQTGYDVFSRLLYATRTSLYASLIAITLAVIGGSILGLLSGYVGGWLDTLLMRCTDAIMAFPGLLMAMAVVGILGPGTFNAMVGLSIAFMPGFARLIRGQVLAVREEGYVEAARVVGAGGGRIVRRHVIPNIAPPLIVQVLMSMGFALLAEGALAFLGLSVQPPQTSLGSMLQQGFTVINSTARLVLIPGIVIVILSLSFNAVADGIRDALAKQDTVGFVGAQA
jgi:ABC-type dipeptide/oligopeptide/nickel transport system permease subunit